ncbi:hypothetical protein [Paracoccus sp. ME4]|uniref:hypothetical protein n=1 Tax=Paracoccus sp. ME4 TaxID=3138066 RepID=UPI00398AAB62
MCRLSDAKLAEIQHELEGTCTTLTAIIERHQLDIGEDELEDQLLDGGMPIERSVCCEWWFGVSELEFDEERGGGVCAQCEPEAFG